MNNVFAETIDRVAAQATQRLDAVLGGFRRVALLDFPNYGNVGDSAIWLGQVEYLRRRGIRVAYAADGASVNARTLRRTRDVDAILLLGGGNLGDLFPHHQRFREWVLTEFTDIPIVQLPQTLHFQQPEALASFVRIARMHPAFVLLVRDRDSLAAVQASLPSNAFLCPDSAFLLGDLSGRRPAAQQEVLLLARSDRERRGERLSDDLWGGLPPAPPVDWLQESGAVQFARRHLPRLVKRLPGHSAALRAMVLAAGNRTAAAALERGVGILGRGRVVVTDRLHAHILSLLLGIPHVVVDSGYGKISRFIDTWHTTGESALLVERDGAREAVARLSHRHGTVAAAAGTPARPAI